MWGDAILCEYCLKGAMENRIASLRTLHGWARDKVDSLVRASAQCRDGPEQLFPGGVRVAYLPAPFHGCCENGRPKAESIWIPITHDVHSLAKLCFYKGMLKGDGMRPALYACPGLPP